MKKEIEKIERQFHKEIMGIKCCNGKLKYKKKLDRKLLKTIETYWCPECGSILTRTLNYIDKD